MFVDSILVVVILTIMAVVAIATMWKAPIGSRRAILAAIIVLVGIISAKGLIPVVIFWMLAGGTIAGLLIWKMNPKKVNFAWEMGAIISFLIIVLALFTYSIVPYHIVDKQSSQIELLPQDDAGTFLYGTANVVTEKSTATYISEESMHCHYLYYSNESLGIKIIGLETKRLPSIDNKGYITTYERHYKRDYSQWPYYFFYSGLPEEMEEPDTFKVIYVPNETIKMSPEFALYYNKGSLNTS
jgi:hypothetical protein